MFKKILFLLIVCIGLVGCSAEDSLGGAINYEEALKLIDTGVVLVDVRTTTEYEIAHIDGAVSLPVDSIDSLSAKKKIGDKDTPVIVYCASGKRSGEAYQILKDLGYTKVYDLGSITNWKSN